MNDERIKKKKREHGYVISKQVMTSRDREESAAREMNEGEADRQTADIRQGQDRGEYGIILAHGARRWLGRDSRKELMETRWWEREARMGNRATSGGQHVVGGWMGFDDGCYGPSVGFGWVGKRAKLYCAA